MRTENLAAALALVAMPFLASHSLHAESKVHIIELKHRSAQKIAPLTRPLLGPNDAVSAAGCRPIAHTFRK